ncbi:MAG: hypothetical protein QXH16_05535 [Candidatus Bathyarchaeia archaeon]
MNTPRLFKVTVLLPLLLSINIIFTQFQPVSGDGDLPPLNIGDESVYIETWKFKDGTAVIFGVTSKVQRTEQIRGHQAYLIEYTAREPSSGRLVYFIRRWVTGDWLLLMQTTNILAAGNVTYVETSTPPVRLLASPLRVGETWGQVATWNLTKINGTISSQGLVEYSNVECYVTSSEVLEFNSGKFHTVIVEQRRDGVLQSRSWVGLRVEGPLISLDMRTVVKYEDYSMMDHTVTGELVSHRSVTVGEEDIRLVGLSFVQILEVVSLVVLAGAFYKISRFVKRPRSFEATWNLLDPVGFTLMLAGLTVTALTLLTYSLIYTSNPTISFVLINVLTRYSLLEWSAFLLCSGSVPLIFRRLGFSPRFLAVSTTAGIWILFSTIKLLNSILNLQGSEYFYWLIIFIDIVQSGVGPGLIVGGVLSCIFVVRDWEVLSKKDTKTFDYLVVASTVAAITFIFNFEVASRILGLGIFTWVVWSLVSPKLSAYWVAGVTSRRRVETAARYIFYLEDRGKIPFKFSGVFRRSILPLQMSFGTIPLIVKVFNPIPVRGGGEFIDVAMQNSAVMVRLAWFVVPTVIFFAGPLKWMMEESGVRRCDKRTNAFDDLSLGLFEEFVGVGSIISLLDYTYDATSRDIGLTILMAMLIVVTLLPITLLATALYVRISINRHTSDFIESLRALGLTVTSTGKPGHEPSKLEMPAETAGIEYCYYCGSPMPVGGLYCKKCGRKQ